MNITTLSFINARTLRYFFLSSHLFNMMVNTGLFSFSHLFFLLHIPLLTKSGCVSQAVLYIIYNMKYKYVIYFIFSSPTQPFLSADIGGVNFYSCFFSITKCMDSKAIQILPQRLHAHVFSFFLNIHIEI